MRTEVTDEGLVIPKKFLVGVKEVEIRKENNVILIIPIVSEDPIFQLGRDPITDDITDASINHDKYIYKK